MRLFSFVQVGFLNSTFHWYCSNMICAAHLRSDVKMDHSLGTQRWTCLQTLILAISSSLLLWQCDRFIQGWKIECICLYFTHKSPKCKVQQFIFWIEGGWERMCSCIFKGFWYFKFPQRTFWSGYQCLEVNSLALFLLLLFLNTAKKWDSSRSY